METYDSYVDTRMIIKNNNNNNLYTYHGHSTKSKNIWTNHSKLSVTLMPRNWTDIPSLQWVEPWSYQNDKALYCDSIKDDISIDKSGLDIVIW